MTRREPCLACSNISKCKWIQDGIDDTMLDEDGSYFPDISEGEYLKVMNQLKEMYDEANSYHKKICCDDCEEEKEEEEEVESEDESEQIEVEDFHWRGTDYLLDATQPPLRFAFAVGVRRLWDPNTQEVVGHVDSTGLVQVY